ncbi:MAG: ABC transporter permease, partial [Planctomycetales bacterium]|nr:ABC transporter permease [Planctomycetales bacterium]
VEGQSFQEYYFPGTMMLILLFTSIFATISIIEDRREGFLQSVLVAPVPRWAMVLGKILGATLIGVAQGLVFLLLALTMGIRFTPITGILIAFWLFLSATGLTALGFLLAWRMDSTQGFHAIMNLLLMPLWLLSGSFFPIPTLSAGAGAAQTGMHWVMRCNPVTYAVAGLRHLLYRDMESPPFSGPDGVIWTPAPSQCMLVVVVFALVMVAWAIWQARRHTAGDLK